MAINKVKLSTDEVKCKAFDGTIENWIDFILCHNLSAEQIAYKYHRNTIKKICQYLGLKGDQTTTELEDANRLERFLKAPSLYKERIDIKKN